MKFSEIWLRQRVSPKLDTKGLASLLTMAGLEVGSVEPVATVSKKIVAGRIETIEVHPDADRLTVCQVNVGKKSLLQIVCGASNAQKGLKVPVALVGATLASGMEIKKAALRGIESNGMLCSAAELGLAESSDGLLVLDDNAIPGADINEVLALADNIIEIDLTPNRGDCLGVDGIAREVSALSGMSIKPLKIPPVKTTSRKKITVTLTAKKECPHYVGRVIENIDPSAATPVWMQERLRRSGLRSLGPVVDVTNYVLLELGQPMHAFDLAKIAGGIKVVKAKSKHKLALLDGSTADVVPGTLLISDNKRPLALAGIMGGADSAVSVETQDIFLESAFFLPEAIAGRARSMGLHTDSSHRFERGVDPLLQKRAIDRATELLLSIVGGNAGPVIEKKVVAAMPKRQSVSLRYAKLQQVLGLKLTNARVQTILKRLGMKITATANGLRVTPPSYRFDIEREVDLIEEVIRVHGYHHVPEHAPRIAVHSDIAPELEVGDHRLRRILVARDYQEVITYSFIDPKLASLIEPDIKPLALANPISGDMAVMRTSLWPGLLQALQYNQNRQQNRVRLFELGRCFITNGKGIDEIKRLSGAVSGLAAPKQWGQHEREVDFFDAKADLAALMAHLDAVAMIDYAAAEHPALQPGQTAKISQNGSEIGIIGRLHPRIQAELSLDQSVILFELTISALNSHKILKFRSISRFPAIRRDIAVVVDISVPAAYIEEVATKAGGGLLEKLELFDDYRGEGIDSGRKSLALGLTLQDSSRTLKEVEVEKIISRVVVALEQELGAELRS